MTPEVTGIAVFVVWVLLGLWAYSRSRQQTIFCVEPDSILILEVKRRLSKDDVLDVADRVDTSREHGVLLLPTDVKLVGTMKRSPK